MRAKPTAPDRARSGWPQLALGLLAVVYAVVTATWLRWVSDDAFISFRYAEQLVGGAGLVFNPGERVEGYSNFLWTLWIAAGMKLGVDPETWSVAWGIAFFAGTVLLLALRAWGARRSSGPAIAGWPIAAALAAAHFDWQVFATSGLETSFFTFHAVLIYVLLTAAKPSLARIAWAGAASAMIAMNRPEGLIFAALGGLFVLAFRSPRWKYTLAFAAGLLLLWLPYTAWRLWYFGDFFTNPYYAKSAYLSWYAQGWAYLLLYFRKYWVALLGLPMVAIAMLMFRETRPPDPSSERRWREQALLAAAFAAGYTAFVLRVGGDFMFARFMIPATPFLLILLELGLERITAGRRLIGALAPAACLIAMIAMPHPLPAADSNIDGIVNERLVYPAQGADDQRRRGVMLATKYFHDLPVRMAFFGSEARLAFYARPMVAIESETGLTDRFIARQPVTQRGRVGHEKHAPLDYLTRQRGAHVVFHRGAPLLLDLAGRLPNVEVQFDDATGQLLTWDPALMTALRDRGARFRDFPARLDTALAGLDTLSKAQVEAVYAGVTRFYFAHVDDPERESRFRRHLGLAPRIRDSAGTVR